MEIEKALQKIEKYCAYSDRCIYEVEKKMNKLEIQKDKQTTILENLKQKGFLNEMRFAESFVHGKFYLKHWGRIKIKTSLRQKHIEDVLIDSSLKIIPEEDYKKTLLNLIKKKERNLERKKLEPYEKKIKLMRFLQSKGFELNNINEALKDVDLDSK